jgi:hypothetical protein
MFVSTHVIISFVISLILYPFFGLYSIFFFLAGFLIDVDHNIEYALANKNLNPFKAYKDLLRMCEKSKDLIDKGRLPLKDYRRFHIFHSLEFIFLLAIFSFFNKIVFLIFLGIFIHVILDLIDYFYLRFKSKKEFDIGRHYFAIEFLCEFFDKKRD